MVSPIGSATGKTISIGAPLPLSTARNTGQSEPVDLQQDLQQTCASGLLLGFGRASASILSPYFTSIKHLLKNTYKPPARTVDPKVEGSSPFGLDQNRVFDTENAVSFCAHLCRIALVCA